MFVKWSPIPERRLEIRCLDGRFTLWSAFERRLSGGTAGALGQLGDEPPAQPKNDAAQD